MLALLFVLLLPVSGWAEEALVHEYPVYQGQPVVHCRTSREQDLGYVMEGPGCQKHLMPECYQRMQEAMRDMDRYIASKALPTIKADALSMYARWDATMAECVRGK